MKLLRLNNKQITKIYKERMVKDFPKEELKPLAMIKIALFKHQYECLGLFEEEEIRGYVFLVKLGDDYLVDYLATFEEIRNSGYGCMMLGLLSEHLAKAKSIILEVENPDFAVNEDEKNIRTRRYGFYLRNGFIDTGVEAECFGVHFKILETGTKHEDEFIRKMYSELYKSILPKKLYEKNINI